MTANYAPDYEIARAAVRAARRALVPPVAYLWPWQAKAAAQWSAWFAWFPVWTDDHGWRWLRPVYYRRCFRNAHVYDGFKASWIQYSGVKL